MGFNVHKGIGYIIEKHSLDDAIDKFLEQHIPVVIEEEPAAKQQRLEEEAERSTSYYHNLGVKKPSDDDYKITPEDQQQWDSFLYWDATVHVFNQEHYYCIMLAETDETLVERNKSRGDCELGGAKIDFAFGVSFGNDESYRAQGAEIIQYLKQSRIPVFRFIGRYLQKHCAQQLNEWTFGFLN